MVKKREIVRVLCTISDMWHDKKVAPNVEMIVVFSNTKEKTVKDSITFLQANNYLDNALRITEDGHYYLIELLRGALPHDSLYDEAYEVLGYENISYLLMEKMAEYIRANSLAKQNQVTYTHATSKAFAELEAMMEIHGQHIEEFPGEKDKLRELRLLFLSNLSKRIKLSKEKGRPVTPVEISFNDSEE